MREAFPEAAPIHNPSVNCFLSNPVPVFAYLFPTLIGYASFYLSPLRLFPLESNICAVGLNKKIRHYFTFAFRDHSTPIDLF
jgi:hypothetical protein